MQMTPKVDEPKVNWDGNTCEVIRNQSQVENYHSDTRYNIWRGDQMAC